MTTLKDFQNVINQQTFKQQIKDPYKFTTPEVQQQIKNFQISNIFKLLMGAVIANVVTAPFQTISTSLQLSVLPHKHIFSTPQMRTKQLAKLNTQLTLHQKKNLQLMLRTGGQFTPYTAPVYEGYSQTVRNLMKQGWKAFFKGLTFRTLHTYIHFYPYAAIMDDIFKPQAAKQLSFTKLMVKLIAFQTIGDIGFNFLHILQNRYILQNNIPQFKVFRSTMRATARIFERGQFKIGIGYHFINSLADFFLRTPSYLCLLSMNQFNTPVKVLYYLSEFLIYPWATAFKRLVCQSTVIPGMIPVRYDGLWHGFKVIAFQQGVRGLWKGFGLHNMTIFLRLLMLEGTFIYVQLKDRQIQ